MSFSPELLDLLDLVARLKEREAGGLDHLEGYLEGKTCLRDALISDLDCSELEAEQVVDTMVARGFVCFRDASGEATAPGASPGYWELVGEPSAR
jgi:hypothetical protein